MKIIVTNTQKKLVVSSSKFSIWKRSFEINNNPHSTEFASVNSVKESVMIAALDEKGKYLIVKKYCSASNSIEYVFPGGKVEKYENPAITAQRELAEETKYYPKKISKLITLEILPHHFLGRTHIFHAKTLIKDPNYKVDKGEYFELEHVSLSDLVKYVRKNKIRDTRTVATILFVKEFIDS